MKKLLYSILLWLYPNTVVAGVYYDLAQHVSSATMKVAGDIKIYQSTSSRTTPTISLTGYDGKIDASHITASSMTSSYADLNSILVSSLAFRPGGFGDGHVLKIDTNGNTYWGSPDIFESTVVYNTRVGISTGNPQYNLDVNGDINFTGNLYKNGSLFTSGEGYTSFVKDDFTSQTNGSKTQFTLSQSPLPNSLQVSKNGLVLKSTADYSLAGQVITMVTAPSSNTALLAMYAIGVSTDEATIIQDGAPIGSFIAYSSTISPQGYLYCDGGWINKNSYPDLFAVTGYRYSTFTLTSGDWFQLPDLRGMFLRGDDTYNNKSLGYRVVGSTQTDAFQGHKHSFNAYGGEVITNSGFWRGRPDVAMSINWVGNPTSDGTNGDPRTASETRPMNTAVAYHIKYANIGTATIRLSSANIILASSNTWTGVNTYTNNTIFNSSVSINANTSQQYALTIDSNSNTSDGYVVTVTTSGYFCAKGQYCVIAEYKVTSNATSVIFDNLSLKNYWDIQIKGEVRNCNANTSYYLYFNNDTTNSNYRLQHLEGISNSVTAGFHNLPEFIYLVPLATTIFNTKIAKTDNYWQVFTEQSRGDNTLSIKFNHNVYMIQTENITKIEIRASNSNCILSGSEFIILGLKR